MNGVSPDHNAARWLTVKYLDDGEGRSRCRGRHKLATGWYVVRTCPCHFGENVTLPLPSQQWAEDVRDVMLSVSS
jgi:hypothetical protein